jgi:hypothetical protein
MQKRQVHRESALGQSRHFDRGLVTSGPPLETDIVTAGRHFAKSADSVGFFFGVATEIF